MTDSDKKHLSERLDKGVLMAVATYGQEHPWIATVYYVHDNELNLLLHLTTIQSTLPRH